MTIIRVYQHEEGYANILKIVEYIKDEICKRNISDHIQFMDCPTYIEKNNKQYYCRELVFNDYKGKNKYNQIKMNTDIIQKIIKVIESIRDELYELYNIEFYLEVETELKGIKI
jgi:hypothetical protein